MAIAFGMERIAYRPLRKAPRLAPLITAIGMSIILQNLALIIWGRNYRTFPPLFQPTPYNVFGASMTDLQMLIVVLAALADGRADVRRAAHAPRHGDARDGAEPAGGRAHGDRHQRRDLRRLRHRRRARRGRRADGHDLLRHRALLHGLPARPEGVHRGGARRHRQSRRRDARRASCSASSRRWALATSATSPTSAAFRSSPIRCSEQCAASDGYGQHVRQQLPGRVRVLRADPGADLPSVRACWASGWASARERPRAYGLDPAQGLGRRGAGRDRAGAAAVRRRR